MTQNPMPGRRARAGSVLKPTDATPPGSTDHGADELETFRERLMRSFVNRHGSTAGAAASASGEEQHHYSIRKSEDPSRTIGVEGLKKGTRNVYFGIVSMPWPVLIGFCLAMYVLAIVVFAILFKWPWTGEDFSDCVTGASTFSDAMALSTHTLSTVGYGSFYPTCDYGETIVMLEAFLGMLMGALLTGVVYTKFAAPSAEVEFSSSMVMYDRETPEHPHGERVLQFRITNTRGDVIWGAHLDVAIMMKHTTSTGEAFFRQTTLELERDTNPMFTYMWLCTHVVDEYSPLHGLTEETWAEVETRGIFCTLSGVDSVLRDQIFTRHSYSKKDVKFNKKFVGMIAFDENEARVNISLNKVHDIEDAPEIMRPDTYAAVAHAVAASASGAQSGTDGSPTPGDASPSTDTLAELSGTDIVVESGKPGKELFLFRAERVSSDDGADDWHRVDLDDLFGDGQVAVFGVVGAFARNCSASHVPSIAQTVGEMQSAGIERIVVMVPESPDVVHAWKMSMSLVVDDIDDVTFIADPGLTFHRMLGLIDGVSAQRCARDCARVAWWLGCEWPPRHVWHGRGD